MAAKKKAVKKASPHPAWTEARFHNFIRSALRSASRKWPPKYEVLNEGRREATEEDKEKWGNRIQKVYHCQECEEWFPQKRIQMDHIEEVGGFSTLDEIPDFIRRLFVAREGWQRLCVDCHRTKTKEYNDKRREELKNADKEK